jgi:hypothetical protein
VPAALGAAKVLVDTSHRSLEQLADLDSLSATK